MRLGYKGKIILLGNGGVGKTSLAKRFVDGTFKQAELSTTIGINFYTKKIKFEKAEITLSIIDMAGDTKLKYTLKNFISGSKATLLVFDLTSKSSFIGIEKWFKLSNQLQSGQEFALIGNKSDLLSKRVISEKDGLKLSEKLNAKYYIETSALTANNVNEAFQNVAKLLYNKQIENNKNRTSI